MIRRLQVLLLAFTLSYTCEVAALIPEAQLCLALNIFHEASIDPYEGRAAVALVTKNRAQQRGTAICWEVFRDQQFTWTETRAKRQALPKGKEWKAALALAREVLKPGFVDFTEGATEYHALEVDGKSFTPWWAPYMRPLGIWGSHKFYKRLDAAHAE